MVNRIMIILKIMKFDKNILKQRDLNIDNGKKKINMKINSIEGISGENNQ